MMPTSPSSLRVARTASRLRISRLRSVCSCLFRGTGANQGETSREPDLRRTARWPLRGPGYGHPLHALVSRTVPTEIDPREG